MTEKRFELTKSDIKDFRIYDYTKEDDYFIDCDVHTGKGLVDLLNDLNDENKQLKNSEVVQEFERRLLNLININKETIEKNRQLKQFKDKVFSTIDKELDDCKPIDYARSIEKDLPVYDCETASKIRTLNELKIELEKE